MNFPRLSRDNNKKFKVLFVRFSSLGDVVLTSHIAKMLKELYPSFELTWLTETTYEPLLKELPWIDRIICWDRRKTGNLGFFKLIAKIRREHFDILFNMHCNDRMVLFTLLSGIAEKIGAHKHFQFVYDQDVYEVVGQLGIPLCLEKQISRSLIRPSGISPLDPFSVKKTDNYCVALAIGASHIRKRWPVVRWEKLIDALLARGCLIVLLGTGKDEEDMAMTLKEYAPVEQVINLTGKLSLEDLIRVIDDSSLLISGDTGPLHIGRALGIKTIALFGPTSLSLAYMKSFTKVLYTPCKFMGCLDWKCTKPCMEEISAESVISAVDEILGIL